MKFNLTDVCNYLKNVIIKYTPNDFIVVEQFRYGLTNTEINAGINAFRTFLYELYDKIATDKSKIAIDELSAILYFMGVQGKLETVPKRELNVRGSDLLVKTKRRSYPHQTMKKMSGKRVAEIFVFLSEMGFHFKDINYSNSVKLSETEIFYVSNENNSDLIIGLKLLAKAQENIPNDWDYLRNGFMRCDFYPLASETSIWHDMKMVNFVDTQPPEIKDWLIDLDKLLVDNNCHINAEIWDYAIITYTSRKTKQMICRIDMIISGCKVTPNTKNARHLDEITPVLSEEFVNALKEDGCTCGRNCKKGPYRIYHNGEEYLSCNNPPHKLAGFNISLNDSENRRIIRKWIELELGCS
ncbi:MAG: hypothetical protein FWD48_00965 [Oscillospiraceae bacterium]|nr:hypothetical protein [Oscillospiraceae bacterium]